MSSRARVGAVWRSLLLTAAVVSSGLAQPNAATLVGTVLDTTGAPVALVRVSVRTASAVTDSAGRFVLERLPAGAATVTARRIGYVPRDLAIELADGRRDSLVVLFAILPQELPGVTSEANAFARLRLSDYYRHRETHMGTFLDRKEIEAVRVTRLSDLLRRIPGARVTMDRNGRYLVRFRGNAGGRDCPPDFWIDGVRATGLNVDDVPLRDIEALEVYKGPSTVPPEYVSRFGNPACGSVVIWTRPPG